MTTEPTQKINIETLKDKPKAGDLIEGTVIGKEKARLYVDIPPFGTGIIYGREYIVAKDIIRKVDVGDTIKAKVTDAENENGYIELSLKEARQALLWKEADELAKKKTVLDIEVKDANKGGLIMEWRGIQGFLPASQLKPEHYPRIEDGDKEKIFKELKKLIGRPLSVVILSTIQKESKLIFSEKETSSEERKEIIGKYSIDDELECEVSGIVDFGIFVKLEDDIEGLVHISELDWGLVDDIRSMFKIGDKAKAKIIEIKDGKISLSIKALKDNPWKEFEGKLKKGDIVKGVVIRFNKYGALISIKEGVAGLVHKSLFESEAGMREKLELGKTYDFQVTLFEPGEQKMTLLYLDPDKKTEEKE